MSPEWGDDSGRRRIAAIVLPELLIEAARRRTPEARPGVEALGVVFQSDVVPPASTERELLAAVNFRAWELGIRIGQTVTEAHAELGSLRVEVVNRATVEQLLAAVVEVAQSWGTSVTYDRDHSPADTVWVDVTGTAHLFGGELALAEELRERVRLLGHMARVVIAPGPRLGRALGRWGSLGPGGILSVQETEMQHALADLPLSALPELAGQAAWFAKTGILTLSQLASLPKAASAARLGPQAVSILALLSGRDDAPLVPLALPEVLQESQYWEEPTEGLEPLSFALRGLLSRLSARLEGRGQATSHLLLALTLEQSSLSRAGSQLLEFEIPIAIWRESELERVVRSRLERLELRAPVLGLQLRASALSARQERQLGLGSGLSTQTGLSVRQESELPLLLAELEAEVGRTHVGILQRSPELRPEAQSQLVPWRPAARAKERKELGDCGAQRETDQATRLFQRPMQLGVPLAVGSRFAWGRQVYTIEKLSFAERLDGVQWWTAQATHRDYSWAWLSGESGGTQALVYVDRRTGQRFLQALYD